MALIHNQYSDSNNFNAINNLPSQLSIVLEDGTQFDVPCHDRITIGRDLRENHECVDLSEFEGAAQSIARRHVDILPLNGQLTIQDLYSVNGSWLNGEAMQPGEPHLLNHGDILQLGEMKLQIQFSHASIQH